MAEYNPDLIPEPVAINPGYVQSTYLLPDEKTPDYEKNFADAVTLQRRLEPDAGTPAMLGLVESGRHYTTYARGWDGVTTKRTRTSTPIDGEYVRGFSPRTSLIIAGGSLVLFNVIGNAPTLAGLAERAVFDLQDHSRTTTQSVPITTFGKPRASVEVVSGGSASGRSAVDPAAIHSFVTKLHTARNEGASIDSVSVIGIASDEDARYPGSIGSANPTNQKLAEERTRQTVRQLETAGIEYPVTKIKQASREQIITNKAVVDALETEAKQQGFIDLISAIKSAKVGTVLDPKLAKGISDNFTGAKNRGATMMATETFPGKPIVKHVPKTIEVSDGKLPPHIPHPGFFGFIPWWPRRKREHSEQTVPKLSWLATEHTIYLPQLVREKGDKVFMRVFSSGVKEDGSLKSDAMWHTDKYEYLLREQDRLQDMLRADLLDREEKPQTLRMLFVDNKLGEEERAEFEDVLSWAARLNGGQLAEVLDMFVIYPAESAGNEHQDPSRVALGQECQLSGNILGTYNKALKLAEIILPAEWTPEELRELFRSFYGPIGVTKHEIGHALKRKEEIIEPRKVLTPHRGPTYVFKTVNPTSDMEAIVRNLKPVDANDPMMQFDITFRVDDADSDVATKPARVTTDSEQLTHALSAQIVDRHVLPRPSYLLRNSESARRRLASEEFADSFAAMAGSGVPFRAAGIAVAKTILDNGKVGKFTRWYQPTKPVQALVETYADAKPGVLPLEPKYQGKVTVTTVDPRKDSLIGPQMTRARKAHSRDGRVYVTYLTEVNNAEAEADNV